VFYFSRYKLFPGTNVFTSKLVTAAILLYTTVKTVQLIVTIYV